MTTRRDFAWGRWIRVLVAHHYLAVNRHWFSQQIRPELTVSKISKQARAFIRAEIDEVARSTLATFLASSRELVKTVITQLAGGDLASVGKAAHSIKGAARSAGAFPLAEIASGIEAAAKSEDQAQAEALSGGLAAELARVEAEIKRI